MHSKVLINKQQTRQGESSVSSNGSPGRRLPRSSSAVAKLFMEWLPSGSVQDILSMTGFRLHEQVTRRYIREALQGLAYLHSKGVLHRDIKPANMLVASTGIVKLSDFGTSKQVVQCGGATGSTLSAGPGSGHMVGTTRYMAPECIVANRYSIASDVWALACSAVQMLSGSLPWSHVIPAGLQDYVAVLFHIGTAVEPNHHPLIPSHVSDHFKALLLACFAKDPVKRPSAAQLLEDPYFSQIGGSRSIATANLDESSSSPPLVIAGMESDVDYQKECFAAMVAKRTRQQQRQHGALPSFVQGESSSLQGKKVSDGRESSEEQDDSSSSTSDGEAEGEDAVEESSPGETRVDSQQLDQSSSSGKMLFSGSKSSHHPRSSEISKGVFISHCSTIVDPTGLFACSGGDLWPWSHQAASPNPPRIGGPDGDRQAEPLQGAAVPSSVGTTVKPSKEKNKSKGLISSAVHGIKGLWRRDRATIDISGTQPGGVVDAATTKVVIKNVTKEYKQEWKAKAKEEKKAAQRSEREAREGHGRRSSSRSALSTTTTTTSVAAAPMKTSSVVPSSTKSGTRTNANVSPNISVSPSISGQNVHMPPSGITTEPLPTLKPQADQESDQQLSLLRSSSTATSLSSSELSHASDIWQYRLSHSQWVNYSVGDSKILMNAHRSQSGKGCFTFHMQRHTDGHVVQYKIDFDKMTQTNCQSGYYRKIRIGRIRQIEWK